MRLEECYERRLLRRDKSDHKKAEKALEMAKERITRARRLAENGFNTEALVAAYTSMFYSSKALLYMDGVIEKSHTCVIEYVKEQYVKKGLLSQNHMHWMNTYRLERHEVMYGLSVFDVTEGEIGTALTKAHEYLEAVKKIVLQNK
ncbi:MAG: HEPN domain-containing protein [Candidatus Altiarchaeota archaeon]